jgi:hypothetical protein
MHATTKKRKPTGAFWVADTAVESDSGDDNDDDVDGHDHDYQPSPAKKKSATKKTTRPHAASKKRKAVSDHVECDEDEDDEDYDESAPVKKLKATAKKAITKKEIAAKLKAARLDELKSFVSSLTDIPEVATRLATFQPQRLPVKPSPDDPLLHRCFQCQAAASEQSPLQPIGDCKICRDCHSALLGSHGNLTRSDVANVFGFSASEAKLIPHKTTSGGRFGGVVYVYSLHTVMRAVNKKYGSMFICL